jgi:hypothetical protein
MVRTAPLQRAQRLHAVCDGPFGDVGSGGVVVEAVWQAGADVQLGGHSGGPQALGVGDTLLSEQVQFPGLDLGRGQAGEVLQTAGCGDR